MDEIIVIFTGGILIIGIIWFFFGKREETAESGSEISIQVEGGYKPAAIKIKSGVETTLRITRTDSNSCLEEIIIPDFKIKKYLPLKETVEIKITPEKKGEFPFHCGMNMYHGKIIVE